MFESNPYTMVGGAMIGQLHRRLSEKAEAAEQTEVRPRRTWWHRLIRLMVNLWPRRESFPDDCGQIETGCI